MAAHSPPLSPYSVRAELNAKYDQLIASGIKRPLTSSSFGWDLFILFLFFLIPPSSRLHNRFTRYTVFTIVLLWHTYMVTCFQARSQAIEYGIGIASAWGTLWAATLLVLKDAKVDFKRVELRTAAGSSNRAGILQTNGAATGSDTSKQAVSGAGELRQRPRAAPHRNTAQSPNSASALESSNSIEYIWQSYPTDTLWHRLCWVADILTNFRGAGWNWRISGLPSLPPHVQRSLQRHSHSNSNSDSNSNSNSNSNDDSDSDDEIKDTPLSRTGLRRYDTLRPLLTHNLSLFFQGYLTIDLLLTLMHHDPFFFTGHSSAPPPAYLAPLLSRLPPSLAHITLHSTRLLISMLMVSTCLRTIFTLAPLVFVGLLSARHSVLRATPVLRRLAFFTSAGKPWAYPDAFGSYGMVFERGLAGWWGGWWHQIFRFAFQVAGEAGVAVVERVVGRKVDGKSQLGKVVSVVVVFFVSGCVHASGSMTQIRESTRPWSGCWAFFMVQGCGLILEGWARAGLKSTGVRAKVPGWLGGVVNFVWVHVWFYWTAGLLVDDFARSGLWCFEPVMISVFRGLGLGVEGDGWYCWGGEKIWWHADERWWLSGIAF